MNQQQNNPQAQLLAAQIRNIAAAWRTYQERMSGPKRMELKEAIEKAEKAIWSQIDATE